MPGNKIDRWLEEKRNQQAVNNTVNVMAGPPSASQRYGRNDMGGCRLAIGTYTGPGPNGVVEPWRPTERRMSVHGQPYMVDENEVVVTNSNLVNRYGGPKALEQSIIANAPGNGNGKQMALDPRKRQMQM